MKTIKEIKQGCDKEFTLKDDGEDYTCGEEFDYDTEESSGCGFLLCPECNKELKEAQKGRNVKGGEQ